MWRDWWTIKRGSFSVALVAHAGIKTLSIAIAGDEPPSEFRLFVPGWNDTEHGRFLFDEEAARAVMSAAAKWGVDLAIDLEHQMLDAPGSDPTARDARGWFRLELRADGSLWAVGVKWTADGAQRLREKRQRYVSPAFEVDPETKRVTKIINVAITAIPATHDTPALVAASLGGKGMTLEEMMKVADALGLGPDATFEDFMAKIDGLKSGAAEPEPDPADPVEPTEPPAEEMTGAPTEEPSKDEEKAAVAASISRLTRITGKSSIGEAVEEVETWRASHVELTAEKAKIAKERAALEANERDTLTASIAKKMGPAVAWSDPVKATDRSKRKPAEPFASMPIVELRGFVTKLGAAKSPDVVTPPVAGEGEANTYETPDGSYTLDAREVKLCAERKIDPAKYAANRAAIRARSNTNAKGV